MFDGPLVAATRRHMHFLLETWIFHHAAQVHEESLLTILYHTDEPP